MLGASMLMLGAPMAIASTASAFRAEKDRTFAMAAVVVCVLALLVTALFVVPNPIVRYLWGLIGVANAARA